MAKKASRIKDFEAHATFLVAESFMLVAQEITIGPTRWTPQITCVAFAAESYLKVIKRLEGGDPLWGHRIDELFYDLSEVNQKKIEKMWNEDSKPTLDAIKGFHEIMGWGETNKQLPQSFADAINSTKDVFLTSRYDM